MTDRGSPSSAGAAIRLAPAAVSLVVFVASVFITLMTAQLNNIRDDIKGLRDDVETLQSDPRPKPETRVEMEALKRTISEMQGADKALGGRTERLEERLNNLHFYIMRVLPPDKPAPPLGRRGALSPLFTYPQERPL